MPFFSFLSSVETKVGWLASYGSCHLKFCYMALTKKSCRIGGGAEWG